MRTPLYDYLQAFLVNSGTMLRNMATTDSRHVLIAFIALDNVFPFDNGTCVTLCVHHITVESIAMQSMNRNANLSALEPTLSSTPFNLFNNERVGLRWKGICQWNI
jgi:hypothetical protein